VVAVAGADLRVLEGARVQLDGHASRSLVDAPVSLTWSQVEGPSIGLTNPSGPSPAFVAPLGATTLRFRLRAEADEQVAFDEVVVSVGDTVAGAPFFVELGRDVTAAPGETVSVTPEVVGSPVGAVAFTAEARCLGSPAVTLSGDTVAFTLPEELPCLLFVEAVDAQGTAGGPATVVLWPAGTTLPAATRVRSPLVSDPGAAVTLAFEGGGTDPGAATRAWPAGGSNDGLATERAGPVIPFDAPLLKSRLAIGTERRRGPASGGARYAFIDVSAGLGNRAPVASGGPDRRIRPGALFTLTTSGSFDLDGDELQVSLTQVIGPPAEPDEVQPDVFLAPLDSAELLFHVTAFDGVVYSAPDSVRVVIDPTIENEPPVVEVEPVRYVAPGRTFRLDASGAFDPDSGFIDHFLISQSPDDTNILLATPVEEPTVELVAGANGEVYRFRLSAFDEAGLAGSADVEVIVEEAGPYVDATLGDDESGDGTELAPFASLGAAVEVATRHRLTELRLGAGPQLPFTGTIGDGLTVRGGYVWDGGAWGPGGDRSELPVTEGELELVDASLEEMVVDLRGAEARVRISGAAQLDVVDITEGPVHAGTLLIVDTGATATLTSVAIIASAPADGASNLVDVRPAAALRLTDALLSGGAGGDRTALRCNAAFVDTVRASIIGASGGSGATGIDATDCDIQLLTSDVTGGTATLHATAVRAQDTVIFVGPGTQLVGVSLGSTGEAAGLVTQGADAPVAIAGTVLSTAVGAGAERAVGIDAGSERVVVFSATIAAIGMTEAVGIRATNDGLQLSDAVVSASSPAGRATALLLGAAAADVTVSDSELVADGGSAFGVDADPDQPPVAPVFDRMRAEAHGDGEVAGVALRGAALVELVACDISAVADGPDGDARAVGLGDGRISASLLVASSSGAAFGVVIAAGPDTTRLERTEVHVDAVDAGFGILGGAPLALDASLLRVSGGAGTAAIDARADVELRHGTLLSTEIGVLASSSTASLDLANSAFAATVGLELRPGTPMPALARSLAFATDIALKDGDGNELLDAAALSMAGCFDCRVIDDLLVDDNGRILPQANHPLVDRADPTYAGDLDIDGESRPQGLLPDVGCDELTTE